MSGIVAGLAIGDPLRVRTNTRGMFAFCDLALSGKHAGNRILPLRFEYVRKSRVLNDNPVLHHCTALSLSSTWVADGGNQAC